MEPSRYSKAPLTLAAIQISLLQATWFIPSNLLLSAKVSNMLPPDEVMIY